MCMGVGFRILGKLGVCATMYHYVVDIVTE